MKRIVWIGLVMLLYGCGSDQALRFIPGVYVAEWTSEFASSRDTLVIVQREGSMVFDIERRTRHAYDQRIREREPEYKVVNWVGIYDEAVQALYVQIIGRVMTFDRDKRGMKMGVVVYRKL